MAEGDPVPADPGAVPEAASDQKTVPIAPDVAALIAAELVGLTSATAAPASDVVEGPGADLGRYRLLEELGHGGMGVVYRARDGTLGRDVALKVLLVRGRVERELIDRFQREARAAAALDHPNIIRVLDVGTLPNGQPYYTMELLHGEDLAHAIGSARLPLRSATEAVRQVAVALAYAHGRGVLHRDVKPQNIFLRRTPTSTAAEAPTAIDRRDGDLHALLLDFGLAKLAEHDFSADAVGARKERSLQVLTQTGQMLGTPAYMAPEQARGARDVDARADVYGLGAALYHALTGRPPFEGATLAELLERVQRADPAPPSRANGEVDADLDTIALKCLQKAPHDRYAGAADLAEDLRRWIAGESISARSIGAVGRLWRRARRNRAVAIPIAVLSLLLLAGLAAWGGIAVRDRVRLRGSVSESEALLAAGSAEKALGRVALAQVLAPDDPEVRRLVARIHVARGRIAKESYIRARDEAEGYDRETEEDEGIPREASEEEADRIRQAAWGRVEERREAQRRRGTFWSEALRPFHEALTQVSDDANARRELAELYWDEFLRAERSRDRADEARYRKLVEDYGGAEFADRVRGEREVKVTFLLPQGFAGAVLTAYLFRYDQATEPPLLVPIPYGVSASAPCGKGELGDWKPLPLELAGRSCDRRTTTRWGSAFALTRSKANELTWVVEPGEDGRPRVRASASLPRGSYLLWIPKDQGVYETRYPIEVLRDRLWEETCELPPEDGPALPPWMESLEGASPSAYWIHLPAGPYRASGDPTATQAPTRPEAWIRVLEDGAEGAFIARFEVTSGMYRAYLDDAAWHTAAAAFRHLPRETDTATEGTTYWRRGNGGFRPLPELTWWTDDIAILSISWIDAQDYCAWLTKKIGGGRWTIDMPTEDEWEHAARGPSGRFYPWGDAFDPAFCRSSDSRLREQRVDQEALPEPVGLFPADESVYGARDLAGGSREWTSTSSATRETWRVNKGGSWSHWGNIARASGRTENDVHQFQTSLGFRIIARRARP